MSQQKRVRGITSRAILLGILLIPFNDYWVMYQTTLITKVTQISAVCKSAAIKHRAADYQTCLPLAQAGNADY